MEDNYVKFDQSITKSVAEQLAEEAEKMNESQNEEVEIAAPSFESGGTGETALSGDQLKKLQAMLSRYRKPIQQVRKFDKVGRNDPCPCGSGKKYKNCCLSKGEYEGLKNVEKYNR